MSLLILVSSLPTLDIAGLGRRPLSFAGAFSIAFAMPHSSSSAFASVGQELSESPALCKLQLEVPAIQKLRAGGLMFAGQILQDSTYL